MGNSQTGGDLFDPELHDNQVVALYDTDAQAQSAREALVQAGVARDAIQLATQAETGGSTGSLETGRHDGVWGAIRSMFVPDEDRAAYTHAVGRGHTVLLVTVQPGVDRGAVAQVLRGTNPVDFDARQAQWHREGYDARTPHVDYGAADAGRAGRREADGDGRVRSYLAPREVERGVTSRAAAAEPVAAAVARRQAEAARR